MGGGFTPDQEAVIVMAVHAVTEWRPSRPRVNRGKLPPPVNASANGLKWCVFVVLLNLSSMGTCFYTVAATHSGLLGVSKGWISTLQHFAYAAAYICLNHPQSDEDPVEQCVYGT